MSTIVVYLGFNYYYLQFLLASACSEFLVENVSDDRLTASSILNVSFSADKARLGSTGWVPDPNIHTDPWIQVTVYYYVDG